MAGCWAMHVHTAACPLGPQLLGVAAVPAGNGGASWPRPFTPTATCPAYRHLPGL